MPCEDALLSENIVGHLCLTFSLEFLSEEIPSSFSHWAVCPGFKLKFSLSLAVFFKRQVLVEGDTAS